MFGLRPTHLIAAAALYEAQFSDRYRYLPVYCYKNIVAAYCIVIYYAWNVIITCNIIFTADAYFILLYVFAFDPHTAAPTHGRLSCIITILSFWFMHVRRIKQSSSELNRGEEALTYNFTYNNNIHYTGRRRWRLSRDEDPARRV